MKPPVCQALDAYLDRDLNEEDRARFSAHLSACPDCRCAVDEAERLSSLLAEATGQEPIPVDLTDRVRHRVQGARRRRFALVAASVAAGVAALAAVWHLGRTPPLSEEPNIPVVESRPIAPARGADQRPDLVRVRFPAGARVLAVPAQSESPNVTVILVYPGLRRAPAPLAEDLPPPSQRSEP